MPRGGNPEHRKYVGERIDTNFVPSIQPIFLTDCTPNDPLCNCPQRVAMLLGSDGVPRESFAMVEGGHRSEARAQGTGAPPSASTLVSTASFPPAFGGKALPADAVAELASGHVERLFSGYGQGTVAALRGPEVAAPLFAPPGQRPVELTLLSRGATDGLRLRVSEALPRLPVLAVAPCVPGARADVVVTAGGGVSEPKEIFSGPAFAVTGRATTVWADIDLADATLPAGTEGQVTLTLRDESKRPVATLTEAFVVAPRWGEDGPAG